MPVKAGDVTPVQRTQFLNLLQMLGGQPAVSAGLEVLAKLDAGQSLVVVPPGQSGITVHISPELLAQVPGGSSMFGLPASDIWKWILKLIECALKNIALALQGKWVEFATAVLTCAFSK